MGNRPKTPGAHAVCVCILFYFFATLNSFYPKNNCNIFTFIFYVYIFSGRLTPPSKWVSCTIHKLHKSSGEVYDCYHTWHSLPAFFRPENVENFNAEICFSLLSFSFFITLSSAFCWYSILVSVFTTVNFVTQRGEHRLVGGRVGGVDECYLIFKESNKKNRRRKGDDDVCKSKTRRRNCFIRGLIYETLYCCIIAILIEI